MKIIMPIIIGCTIFLLLLSLWGFYQAIYPFKFVSQITPKQFGLAYENVSFRTKDNVLIRGWFIPSAKPQAKTIILLHGYPADKGNILPSRIFLHEDFNLLLFDFRYLGESEGKYSTVGKNEVLDLEAAINYLTIRGIFSIGVWGLSLGGSVALMTAQQNSHIKAVVIESAYARLDWIVEEYYHLPLLNYPLSKLTQFWAWLFLGYDVNSISPALAAEKINIPLLLIYSKHDNVVSFRHALLLQKSLQNNPHAQFIFVENLAHGQGIPNEEKIIKEFFLKNLK